MIQFDVIAFYSAMVDDDFDDGVRRIHWGVINIKGRFLKIKNTDYFILSVFYQVATVCLKKITCESVVYLHQ